MEALVWGREEPGEASSTARSSEATSDRSESAAHCAVDESPVCRLWGIMPPDVMDFDHIDGDKRGEVSAFVYSSSTETLPAEAAKCHVVCSNCHRMRTHDRSSIQTELRSSPPLCEEFARTDLLRGRGRRGLQFPADGM